MADRLRVIIARFFAKFDTVPPAKLAEKLEVSEKTLQRLREGITEPRDATLKSMLDLIESHDAEVMATDSERLMRAEQLRANHEKQQREIALAAYEDKVEKRYPRWFERVKSYFLAERYDDAIDTILDHIEDRAVWSQIDNGIKPYVLHTLGVAYYRTGRNIEALEASDRALAELGRGGRNNMSAELQARSLVMRGLSLMRLWRTKEALVAFDDSILVYPDSDGGYYNAICCASLLKAQDLVGVWVGRYIEATPRFSVQDINDVLLRIEIDKDLVFLRELPIIDDLRVSLAKARDDKMK